MVTFGRKLPIGIQTFSDIRTQGYIYVDKTALVWQIANSGKPYFMSRPRRFGKSLLLSTFEAYFEGRKDLFEGLAIEALEEKWEKHAVLHLDLNAEKYDTIESLETSRNRIMDTLIATINSKSFSLQFQAVQMLKSSSENDINILAGKVNALTTMFESRALYQAFKNIVDNYCHISGTTTLENLRAMSYQNKKN